MSAVLGCTYGEAVRNKTARKYIQMLIKEANDLSKHENVIIEPIQGNDIAKLFDYNSFLKRKISYMLIPFAMKKHNRLKPSMLQDLEKGKKTEVDFINGAFSAPTPYNDLVVRIIHEIEEGKREPSFDNLNLFEKFNR